MKHWTHYRWREGTTVTSNHIDYMKSMEDHVICITAKLATFCINHRNFSRK